MASNVARKEHRLSCDLRDCSDASTNFLDQLYSRLVIIIIIIDDDDDDDDCTDLVGSVCRTSREYSHNIR